MPILHKLSKEGLYKSLYRGLVQKWFYVKIPYGKFSQNWIRATQTTTTPQNGFPPYSGE